MKAVCFVCKISEDDYLGADLFICNGCLDKLLIDFPGNIRTFFSPEEDFGIILKRKNISKRGSPLSREDVEIGIVPVSILMKFMNQADRKRFVDQRTFQK